MSEAESARTRRLEDILNGSPFYRHLGFMLDRAEPGCVRIRLPYKETNTTRRSALHGGAIGSLVDATGAVAAWSSGEFPPDRFRGRTLSCDVSYLAGALGEEIYAEGRVLRRGKAVIYSEVRVENGDGKALAYGNHIYRIDERQR